MLSDGPTCRFILDALQQKRGQQKKVKVGEGGAFGKDPAAQRSLKGKTAEMVGGEEERKRKDGTETVLIDLDEPWAILYSEPPTPTSNPKPKPPSHPSAMMVGLRRGVGVGVTQRLTTAKKRRVIGREADISFLFKT